MSYALDANILLYASDESSPKYSKAKEFLFKCTERADVLYLPWMTVSAYLRIATHPRIFQQPLSPDDALANVESLISLPQVRLLAEGEGFWEYLRQTYDLMPIRGNLVPDAQLATLLRQHGVNVLYTHDSDFKKFDWLEVRDPFK
ncbi:MAG: PIN domain-containing protein [Gemmatimonadota bacterium]|nr:PIN domain-containing protein [Gemmatimonadota bacterium]MDH5804254.1 PIN domain-containing protein [Gemmatimonadota bacterium]